MAYNTLEKSRVIIKILATIGILTNKKLHLKLSKVPPIYYKLMIHVPLTFTYTTLMWLEVIFSSDIYEATDVLYMVLTETALVVKILSIWYHDALIKSLFNEWQQNEMFKLYTTQEFYMWQPVLFLNSYELPFLYWTPFNWKHPSNYWYAYFYELFAMPLTCLSNCTSDMLLCCMMQHLALYFKLIAMRLENLGNKKGEINSVVTKKLLTIIKFHLKLKSMSKYCERIVSYPILAQILLSAFVLCFSLYRLTNFNFIEDPVTFFSLIQYAMVMNLQIFLPCYYANKLTIESSRLTNSIYNCNWPEMSPFNRKLILMYMQSLQKPVVIKAGNFFEVGLPIYAKTMNNAYSFFALLLNMDVE
ncbi:odorant receptor 94a-like [Lucilia sericata]|uniref:odorant receptor 94a-like n=1 Tax=Lucilia sericata TaxID=13632 RepID=UPI0018A81536|nr:odorant receptor 94a-like [Lucilia sericata]